MRIREVLLVANEALQEIGRQAVRDHASPGKLEVYMQIRELQSMYRAQPFRPFVMHLADGRSTRVEHPELMALSPTGRSAVVYGKDGAFEVIDVMLVTSLGVSDGRPRSRRKQK